ncbi:glycosyltransferase family 4 protein [Thermococcus stetteri]|uniref:glycosyltransferase family 4 protein n=1 Tax=Thermococcus stetteri TaxID=49900 RepID=UPI001AE28943|nr:glycosyltransferase family 4 protein [Thermococcus stetteri]MBP1911657.1 glycosyltransferase involved in cell wall biosynthesis [Thermococcus stetteri]
MKILQVVHGFPPKKRAGTEIYTYYLSKELAKRHEVHVLYPSLGNVKKPTSVSFTREGLILHELKLPKNKVRRFWNLLFFENTYMNKNVEEIFKKLLKEIKPDIIHFEHLIGLSTTLIDIAKEFDVSAVLTLHDYWFMCPNIQLLKYDYAICEGPEPNKCRECWVKRQASILSEALNHYHIPKLLVKKPLEFVIRESNSPEKFKRRNEYLKNLVLKVDKIIAPSRFLREMFIKYGIPEDKIVYSENGYNLDAFKGFKKKEKDTDKIIFGFVGGISKHKGVHILVDAFMNVPKDKAELRIYGNYNPNSRYIKEILVKTKSRNIKFMGRFEDVKEPYSEIDILVVPSIWHETGGPLVVKEAFATKTPVIASNIGCIPEFVENGKTGLLFKPNDTKDLYKKIMEIIENPELIDKFKSNITPPKSIEEQAKEIEGIYKSLMGGDSL